MQKCSFNDLWLNKIGNIMAECAKLDVGNDQRAAEFVRDFIIVLDKLSTKDKGNAEKSGPSDLPFLIIAALLETILARNTSGKRNGKKSARRSLCALLVAAHQEQHASWGDRSWPETTLSAGLSEKLLADMCVREIQELSMKIPSSASHSVNKSQIFSYAICLGFFQARGLVNIEAKPSWQNSGIHYVTEWPRRSCPVCGMRSYPVIEPASLDETNGFRFKCQFCNHLYGFGGKKKDLRIEGKRILSTVWTADRLEIDSCQFCGLPGDILEGSGVKLEAHHIIPVSENGEDIPSNILVLCPECHKEAHRRRDAIKFRSCLQTASNAGFSIRRAAISGENEPKTAFFGE